MNFGQTIREYETEILDYLAELIAIPSVSHPDQPLPGKPFGEESARALESILSKGAELGFSVKNVGNYAGHVSYDCGEGDYAAVLSHVDVVPVGSGWETDPFTLTEKDGLLYGRGVLDDKGSAVISLFCLKALKDHGVVGNRSIRCIFGAGEEVGMCDLEHYFAEEPLPSLSFTPDGEYGICNREKGILHFTLETEQDFGVIHSFTGGYVANAVPDTAQAVVDCTQEQCERLQQAAESSGEDYTLTYDAQLGRATVTVNGRAAHGSKPEDGHNAIMVLLMLLSRVFVPEQLGKLPSFLAAYIKMETDGTSLSIAQSDAYSGSVTLNVGVLSIEEGAAKATIDIRYPVTASGEAIIETICQQAKEHGVFYQTMENLAPLYAEAESPLVTVLSEAYESVTGEKATLYATGGGSYARCIPGHCVAFGPLFPGEPNRRLHESGEHMDKELFFRHAEICLEAMYRMIQMDL